MLEELDESLDTILFRLEVVRRTADLTRPVKVLTNSDGLVVEYNTVVAPGKQSKFIEKIARFKK